MIASFSLKYSSVIFCFLVKPVFMEILLFLKFFLGSGAGKMGAFSAGRCPDDALVIGNTPSGFFETFPGQDVIL